MVCSASGIGARSAALVCFLSSVAAFAAPVPVSSTAPAPKIALPVETKAKEPEPSASDLMMGFSLLHAPPGTPEKSTIEGLPDDSVKALCFGIQTAAIRLELMDPREARYILGRREDFQSDLDLLRRRRVDLDGAPLLVEAHRLPPRAQVNEYLRFNRAHHKYLEELFVWDTPNQPLIQQVMRENQQLYQVWDSIRDARCDFYYVTVRRLALKKLKSQIGDEAYYALDLPPNVPIWRFREMK